MNIIKVDKLESNSKEEKRTRIFKMLLKVAGE